MKKVISINIGGRVIQIEHNAWQLHLKYIETLHGYFINEEDCFEIINDIENRMAELMKGIINERSTCINEMDMKNIITIMGTVDDFKELDTEEPDMNIMLPENTFYYSGGYELCNN